MAQLRDTRSFRPFKSSEEYLYAMKEDLAEWLSLLYPDLRINVDNFMDRLDTGVALCKHANAVRYAAEQYVARRQARAMTTSTTSSSLAVPVTLHGPVSFLEAAKPGTFFARDNVSNFIAWCRRALGVFEVLLFETDDLILRKNEKHVILTLLEVARRGARLGMAAPMLVHLERQIDREIAAEMGDTQDLDSDDELEPFSGPQPQIVTNDLKSLDEMVRDLVERCQCPVQFPMIRVSEGKYRIGDKVLIFVRVLRKHVMVRVGGGWDTLSHYLDKHDPCRCKTAHRSPLSAKLILKNAGALELNSAQVHYERSPPRTRRSSASSVSSSGGLTVTASPARSRSPTPRRSLQANEYLGDRCRSPSLNLQASEDAARRSRSPSFNLQTPDNVRGRSQSPSCMDPKRRSRSPSFNLQTPDIARGRASPVPSSNLQTPEIARGRASPVPSSNLQTPDNARGRASPVPGRRSRSPSCNLQTPDNARGRSRSPSNNNNNSSLQTPQNARARSRSPSNSTLQSPQKSAHQAVVRRRSHGGSTEQLAGTPVRSQTAVRRRSHGGSTEHLVCPEQAKGRSRSYAGSTEHLVRRPDNDSGSEVSDEGYRSLGTVIVSPQSSGDSKDGGKPPQDAQPPQRRDLPGSPRTQTPHRQPRPGSSLAKSRPPQFARGTPQRRSMPTSFQAARRSVGSSSTPSSVQTSPTRQVSPLIEEILQVKQLDDDACVLRKMRELIQQYAHVLEVGSDLPQGGEDDLDFTTAWVRGNGSLDGIQQVRRKGSCASVPGDLGSTADLKMKLAVNPRKDSKPEGSLSRIPMPVFFGPQEG